MSSSAACALPSARFIFSRVQCEPLYTCFSNVAEFLSEDDLAECYFGTFCTHPGVSSDVATEDFIWTLPQCLVSLCFFAAIIVHRTLSFTHVSLAALCAPPRFPISSLAPCAPTSTPPLPYTHHIPIRVPSERATSFHINWSARCARGVAARINARRSRGRRGDRGRGRGSSRG